MAIHLPSKHQLYCFGANPRHISKAKVNATNSCTLTEMTSAQRRHTAIPFWHCCASLHSQWSGKQDCLCLYRREDKNRYSLWIISHKRRRDMLPVPTRNVGSWNSIWTKQPRRCLRIHPPRLHATCLALREQLECKIKIVSGWTKTA